MAAREEYAFQDLSIVMLGRTLGTARGFRYKAMRPGETIATNSVEPQAFARGPKSYEGSITLLLADLLALDDAAGAGNDVTQIPPFVMTGLYKKAGSVITRPVTVQVAGILECEVDWKAADTFKEITLPLLVTKVDMK